MTDYIKNLSIRIKLIIIFVVIKVIPVIVITWIAVQGAIGVSRSFVEDSTTIAEESKKILEQTSDFAIENSIEALDDKSRLALERLTLDVAGNIADFLYQRDQDLLFLATLELDQTLLENFQQSRTGLVTVHAPYDYDEETEAWVSTAPPRPTPVKIRPALEENTQEFNYIPALEISRKEIPLYKEITFYDPAGNEQLKVSTIDPDLKNIADPANTYLRAEDYYQQALDLEAGETYVSEVIGPQLKSQILDDYTRPNAEAAGIPFAPEEAGYAGVENPVGRRFTGIVRFVTPVFRTGRKIGYLTLALDHTHLMEFTDYIDPTEGGFYNKITDASTGDYAFMFDYEGKSIAHPRHYLIVGHDPQTGKLVPGLVSQNRAEAWKASSVPELGDFLATIPPYTDHSLDKAVNVEQIRAGWSPIDCRYADFAPQCQGWYELTAQGGGGSFIIFWDDVWKLTTFAPIPYYTGRYGRSPRGFGYIVIGANVDEFHRAAERTERNVDALLAAQNKTMETAIDAGRDKILANVDSTINHLWLWSGLMVLAVILVAIWMSNTITHRLAVLVQGAQAFANKDLEHRIDIDVNDEVGQLAAAFNEMAASIQRAMEQVSRQNEELKRLDKLKDEFLANTSHELRTPLHGVIGLSESLLDGVGGPLSRTQAQNLQMIVHSSRRLTSLIDDLLDFSKLKNEALQLNLRPVDTRSVTDVVLALAAPLVGQKPLTLCNQIPDSLPLVMADENRLQQIMLNLVANAVKFTHQGQVTVSARQENSNLTISVTDTGIGVPPEKQPLIFEAFRQADGSISREYGGTGLGLTVTRQLVELHGGRIMLDSAVDAGSTFSFTLPLTQASQRPDAPPPRPVSVAETEPQTALAVSDDHVVIGEGQTILVVDDETTNLQVIENQLTLNNFKVLKAQDGLQALKLLEETSPDLLLLDLMMPRMSGYELCRLVRETYSLSALPVLMMTAKNQPQDIVAGLEAGANDYLTKPFDKRELLARVKTLLTLKQAVEVNNQLVMIQQELDVARRIQKNLLPDVHPPWPRPVVCCYNAPARQVSGDFYDYYAFEKNMAGRYGLVVGDVTGKGIPAALLMATSITSFRAVIPQAPTPADLLSRLDQSIGAYTKSNQQNCAFIYVEIRLATGGEQGAYMRAANAGCVSPLIRRSDGSIAWVDVGGTPLGTGLSAQLGYEEVRTRLWPGDLVILTSDGVVEARDASGQMFSFERLEEVVAAGPAASAQAMLAHLQAAVDAFVGGAEPHDDLTVVVVQI